MNERLLEQFELLLFDWEDGTIDDAGLEKLREILHSEPEARKRFVELQMLGAAMHLEGDAGLQLPTSADASELESPRTISTPSSPASLNKVHWFSLLVAVAACLLVTVSIARWLIVESRLKTALESTAGPTAVAPVAERTEATAQGIALVTRLVDVAWADDASSSSVGDALSPGLVEIESGLAQIEFFCGATVVLEGPAAIDLQTSTSARLLSGRLRAQVPPAARGFEVHVDEMRVVDLGTEFGISVTPDKSSVQVFDGEVELHQPDENARRVTAGNAVIRSDDGKLDKGKLTPSEFVDLQALDSQAQDQSEDRYVRWQQSSNSLRRDPRLIAYYSMDEDQQWHRKLPSSMFPENRELDGAIVGAKRVSGRWPNKDAIEFKRPGDRVRVFIPGEYESLTFACWVKIDSLDRWYNSLFLTDNYQRGEPHWQILDTGQLFFSVRVSNDEIDTEHREVLSPPFWKPSMSGQWLHLATTYDVQQQRTTHYLNGKILSEETIPDVQLVPTTRIGKASIGNWSLPTKPDAEFAVRNLNGSIDEFALFAAALSPEEILKIYENGKP